MSEIIESHNKNSVKPKKYYARTLNVYPISNRFSFENKQTCFLGISLENKNFTPEKFIAMAKWINQRFSHCQILIGDSIHRITVGINKGLAPEQAYSHAMELGQSYIQQTKSVLAQQQYQTEFSFITCDEIQKSAEYHHNYNSLETLYSYSSQFKKTVEEFAFHFHRQHWEQLSEYQRQYCIHQSSHYFLEELAVFASLSQQKNDIMIYPGSLDALGEIVEGKHQDIVEGLKQLTVVSLTLKRR